MFGALDIRLLDDQIVSAKERNHRLLLLKHLMGRTLLKRWPVARQLHNCVLQATETNSISWEMAFDRLAQWSQVVLKSGADSINSDKVLTIICKSYNSDNTDGDDCAFSREGKINCSKLHICMLCAKQCMNFKHPERRCRRTRLLHELPIR